MQDDNSKDRLGKVIHKLSRFEYDPLLILASASFLFSFGFSCGGLLQPLYTQNLKMNASSVGILFFTSNLASTMTRLPAGILSDRYSKRLSISLASICFATSSILFIFVKDFIQLLFPFALWGIGASFYFTASNTLIADLTDIKNRVKTYARIGMFGVLANIISPLLTGYLADNWSIPQTFSLSVISFIFLFIITIPLPKVRTELNVSEIDASWKILFRGAVKEIVITFIILNFIHGFYSGMFWPALTILFEKYHQLTYSQIGFNHTIAMIAGAAGMYICGSFKFNLKRVMIYATILASISTAGFLYDCSTIFLLAISILTGFVFSFGFMSPISTTIFMNHLPPGVRGVSQGLVGTVWRLGMTIGSIGLGTIWSVYGITAIPIVSATVLLFEVIVISLRLPNI